MNHTRVASRRARGLLWPVLSVVILGCGGGNGASDGDVESDAVLEAPDDRAADGSLDELEAGDAPLDELGAEDVDVDDAPFDGLEAADEGVGADADADGETGADAEADGDADGEAEADEDVGADADADDGTEADADPCADYVDCWMIYRECTDGGGVPVCGDCLPGYHDDAGDCVPDVAAEDMIFDDDFVGNWKHGPPVTLGEWDVVVERSTERVYEGTHSLKTTYGAGWSMVGIYLSGGPGAGDRTPVAFSTAGRSVVFHAQASGADLGGFYLTGIAASGLLESRMVPFTDLERETVGAWTRFSFGLDYFADELIGFGVRLNGPGVIHLDSVRLSGACVEGTVQLCGVNEGECHVGLATCGAGGSWGACEGARGPAEEACDGLDNDCDGVTDGEPASSWCGREHGDPGLVCEAGSCVACEPDCPVGSAPCDPDGCGGTCGDCPAVAYRDFGKGDPWDDAQPIHLVPPSETICDNCWYVFTRSAETCALGSVEAPEYCAFWETYDRTGGAVNDVFEYVSRPDAFDVDSWGVKFRKYGRFRIDAAPFASFADRPLFLAIRYKDVVLPGAFGDGASVYVRNAAGWRRLGGIGGAMDFSWKTARFEIAPADRAAAGGHFELAVGRYDNEYSDEMLGEVQLDQVRLALDEALFPESLGDPTPGAGADPVASGFDTIGRDAVYSTSPGAEPLFVYGGFHIQATFTDALADQMTAAHMNTVSTIQWTQPIEELVRSYATVAQRHGMKTFVTMIGEFWPWAVASSTQPNFTRYGHRMQGVLEQHREMIRSFAGGADAALHDAILFWGSKDEVDHDEINGANGGAPPLSYLRHYADMVRLADPDRPHAQLTMGWHGAGEFSVFGAIGDVITEDHYINTESVPEDDLGTRIGRTREIGQRIDDMRQGRDPDGNLILAVPQGMYTAADRIATRDVVAQCYQAIAHGAQGIVFFKFIDDGYAAEYAGMVQVGEELFGTDGLAPLLLRPDARIDVMGESGVVTLTGDPDGKISHLYLTDGTRRWLIAVLVGTSAADYAAPLTVTFRLGDVAGSSDPVDVLFESRTVTMTDGRITDTFDGFGARHVYRF